MFEVMISRRDVLKLSACAGLVPSFPASARDLAAPDYKIDIALVTLELSPRHKLKTTAYNGQVPGPLLRFNENQPVTIEVVNHTDRPEVVHWHGLSPPAVSQMIDRLFSLDLVTRAEASEDRRRKMIAVTHKARQLLERIRKARASEYATGVRGLSQKLRMELVSVLRKALQELPIEAESLVSARTADVVEKVRKRKSSSDRG